MSVEPPVEDLGNSAASRTEEGFTSHPADASEADRVAQIAAARTRAGQFFAEQRYAEARQALEEADVLESGKPGAVAHAQRVWNNLRSRVARSEPVDSASALDASVKTVRLYSKIAAAVGLLPGGLLNFGAVLVVQVAMVWKIARHYGATAGKDRVRGSILSLVGAALPTSLGHGVCYAVAAIPAVVIGNLLYFIVTPVLAYAMTQAVGKAFVMHFESGGTLLTFDPKSFQAYFLEEFKRSGGKVTAA